MCDNKFVKLSFIPEDNCGQSSTKTGPELSCVKTICSILSHKAAIYIKGEKTIKAIVVDQHNQVKQQLIDGRLAMDVQYQRGNPKSLTHGEHTIEYDFDKLNRLKNVSNGLAEAIEYAYANDEEDLRMQQDDRTAGIYIDKAQSDLAATLYTRTAKTPWPHIIWSEALGQLQLALKTGIIPPDTVFRSAAKRRRLYIIIDTLI